VIVVQAVDLRTGGPITISVSVVHCRFETLAFIRNLHYTVMRFFHIWSTSLFIHSSVRT